MRLQFLAIGARQSMTLLNLSTESFIVAMGHALRDLDDERLQRPWHRYLAYVDAGLRTRSLAEFGAVINDKWIGRDMLPVFDGDAFERETMRRCIFGMTVAPEPLRGMWRTLVESGVASSTIIESRRAS
jgi:hypothetical protein